MKKVFNIIFPSIYAIAFTAMFFSHSTNAIAQEKERAIFTIVENMPSYKGCENIEDEKSKQKCTTDKILAYFSENINYPEEAKAKGIEGRVFISYIVEKDGNVTDVQILRGIPGGEILDNEAVRVVESLPDFNPGTQRGETVAVRYNIPINFTMNNDKETE